MSEALAAELMPKLRAFMELAGTLALKNQSEISKSFKADNTLVTETDKAISQMAWDTFDSYFASKDHILIDEESIDTTGTPVETLGTATYTWVIDPIDGTVPYAWGRLNWGISLGVLKNQKPWLGAVYLPAANWLFLHDGNKAVRITNPFTNNEQELVLEHTEVAPIHAETPVDFGSCFAEYFDFDGSHGKPTVLLSAVWGYLSVAMRQSSGAIFFDSAWDFCGCWPIAKATGLDFYHMETGEKIEELTPALLTTNWKKKDLWALTSADNAAAFRKAIHVKQASKVA